MNRFLLTTSAFAVVLSVALASFSLLGFVIGDLPTVFFALALFTIASMFACIIIFSVLAEILLCILVFVLKTSGRNNNRLRLTARRIILSLYAPSDFFFLALLVASTAVALHLTATLLPLALKSPGFPAELGMSIIMWGAINIVDAVAESKT